MDASYRKVPTPQAGWLAVIIAAAVAIALSVATGFLLYRWAGYGTTTRVAAHLAFFVAAIGLAVPNPHALHRPHRPRCAMLGSTFQLLRTRYDPIAYYDPWILTVLGEELLFAGLVFALVAATLPRERRGGRCRSRLSP